MALQSPGVEITVIDESFYTPAEPGTTPLIVVATGQDKDNAAGTGVAASTTKANAGKAFKVTSQKELVDLFGVPFFEKTASNTPIHGSELNEYGLLAAYSLLGVSNAAFIVRADVDLNQLAPQSEAPGANPDDGTWWVNTRSTTWGIQEWNGAATADGGQRFTNKIPLVFTDTDSTKTETGDYGRAPRASVGSIGDYAIIFETGSAEKEYAKLYYKSPGNTQAGIDAGKWVLVGSNDWSSSIPTVAPSANYSAPARVGNYTFTINGNSIEIVPEASLTDAVNTINGANPPGVTAVAVSNKIYLYVDGVGSETYPNQINITGSDADLIQLPAGTYNGPALQMTPHTTVPQWKINDDDRPTGSVWIKTTEPGNGARWRVSQYSTANLSWVSYEAPLYPTTHSALYFLDRTGGGLNIPADSLFVQTNPDQQDGEDETPAVAEFRVWRRAATGPTVITSPIISDQFTAGTNTFAIAESVIGATVSGTDVSLGASTLVDFQAANNATDADAFAAAVNAAGFANIEAAVTADNRITISHKRGGDFRMRDAEPASGCLSNIFTPYNPFTGTGTANFYAFSNTGTEDEPAGTRDSTVDPNSSQYLASNWIPLAADDFQASPDDPVNEPTDGQLWYNPEFSEVDIMVHDGSTWVGYLNEFATTDPAGPQVSASRPTTQSGGAPLVQNDLWISTADLENFPTIYRWDASLLQWVQLDKTDQVTEDGILFADARWDLDGESTTPGSIVDLLSSDHLDPDAPDPALYPKGMLLWNLRRSGGNVKIYRNNYIDTTADNPRMGGASMGNYATDRWTTFSANNEDGSGSFGRKAQRKVVVAAMKSVVDTSSEIRDEERRNFNLIVGPGYPELLSNLVNLNIDRGLTAFVIGDTPLRLPSDATSLVTWGTNANLVTDNGDDGIVTYDEYLATFYPNGFTTDLGGNNAVVPASHMMMRTMALSDQVSYPWFAPAGTRRGGITNATAVGYIDSLSGEFQTVALNEGQRDTLYDLKVNPIAFFNGIGLVNYGQKTRARNASALDRINVARLVVYLRSQLGKLARPYIFEPNDDITRAEIKGAVESLLLELVGLRALYDFAVVCDTSNNTPARIDRNELYVDIAIEPVKAVEFIYIPLRVKNTGEI